MSILHCLTKRHSPRYTLFPYTTLFRSLLMTLKDAAQFSGRKVVVVFSNGPDNASMVAPEDVRELAQSEGIPIYMISTREADRKSTRLNSSHVKISYAVFCLKKKIQPST